MAEGKIHIEVYSPERLVYEGDVDSTIIPGSEGDFEILPGHFAYLASLRIGGLVVFDGGETKYFSVNSGTADIRDDSVTVLTKSSEWKHEIDVERAQNAQRRAEKLLQQAKEEVAIDIDLIRAEAALKRALNRLHLSDLE